MRGSVLTSSVLHGSLFALGFVSIAAPEAYEVREVESVQIELVPVSAIAEAVQGAQNAPLVNTPTPEETRAKPVSPAAENVGEAQDDTQSVKAPDEAPVAVKNTAPRKVDPTPQDAPRISDTPDPAENAAPAPSIQVANTNQERVSPQEQAEPEDIQVSAPPSETAVSNLPVSVPVPKARPERAQAQKATTTQRKVPETQTANATKAPKRTSDAQADDVAALINREKAKAGGAKRVSGQKSLGTARKSTGAKLTSGEHEAQRTQFEKCFQMALIENYAGVEEVFVSVLVNFDEAGNIVGRPKATAKGGDRGAQRHAMRSIVRDIRGCRNPPFPMEKYATWGQVRLNYSMSEILSAGF